jgi:uncharacterized membrane protein
MMKYFATYATMAFTMLALDAVWIGYIAKPLYQQGIGHLMADQPQWAIAGLFYLVYSLGLMIFVVVPYESATSVGKTVAMGALFGLFAYATYDLTNWATLKNWPASVSLADMAWGSFASAVSVTAGYFVLRAMQPA